MNLVEYQKLSKRTMPFGGNPTNEEDFKALLGNYAMGLVGEWFEFSVAVHKTKAGSDEVYKETGDVLHYIVGMLSCLGEKVDFEKIYEVPLSDEVLAEALSDILEIPKKHIYHRHELNRNQLILAVHTVLKVFVESLGKEELSKVMQMNIDKLKTRYPDNFSVEDSIKRVDVNQ